MDIHYNPLAHYSSHFYPFLFLSISLCNSHYFFYIFFIDLLHSLNLLFYSYVCPRHHYLFTNSFVQFCPFLSTIIIITNYSLIYPFMYSIVFSNSCIHHTIINFYLLLSTYNNNSQVVQWGSRWRYRRLFNNATHLNSSNYTNTHHT